MAENFNLGGGCSTDSFKIVVDGWTVDDCLFFFPSPSRTKETLKTGQFLSVINVLMQLRKVCNHPDLFEMRPSISPFVMEGINYRTASEVTKALDYQPLKVRDKCQSMSCLYREPARYFQSSFILGMKPMLGLNQQVW